MNKKALLKTLDHFPFFKDFLKETAFYFEIKRAHNNISDIKYRHLRARVLSHFISRLQRAMRAVNYFQKLLISRDENFILLEGILMTMSASNQYLKFSGENTLNQGKIMYDFLVSKGIKAKTIIDVGANWGEVSLYFSKMEPQARILAVEASTENFKVLQSNCKLQTFNTDNIICVNEAVSNKSGQLEISTGKGAENTSLKNYWEVGATEIVPCNTLSSFINKFQFETVDFLKIDIEGTEPELFDSIKENIQKIKSVIIEVGSKAEHGQYLPMLRVFFDNKMKCYEWQKEIPFNTFEDIEKYAMDNSSVDFWFVKEV